MVIHIYIYIYIHREREREREREMYIMCVHTYIYIYILSNGLHFSIYLGAKVCDVCGTAYTGKALPLQWPVQPERLSTNIFVTRCFTKSTSCFTSCPQSRQYAYTYIYIYTHTHLSLYICVYIHVYTHELVYISLSLYIYIYIYAYCFINCPGSSLLSNKLIHKFTLMWQGATPRSQRPADSGPSAPPCFPRLPTVSSLLLLYWYW